MDSHPDFKFVAGDVVVPKEGIEVPEYMKEITILGVRPMRYSYSVKDLDGDIANLSPRVLDEDFVLKLHHAPQKELNSNA